jgi:hypothetical protein
VGGLHVNHWGMDVHMWWNHTFVVFGANCEHIVSLHEASCPSTNDELLERSVLTYACTASVILTDVNVKIHP